jgi:hypothetical protein
LHDLGSIKVDERHHSWLRAVAMAGGKDVATLVRGIIAAEFEKAAHVWSLADEIHESKGLGKIAGDIQ